MMYANVRKYLKVKQMNNKSKYKTYNKTQLVTQKQQRIIKKQHHKNLRKLILTLQKIKVKKNSTKKQNGKTPNLEKIIIQNNYFWLKINLIFSPKILKTFQGNSRI